MAQCLMAIGLNESHSFHNEEGLCPCMIQHPCSRRPSSHCTLLSHVKDQISALRHQSPPVTPLRTIKVSLASCRHNLKVSFFGPFKHSPPKSQQLKVLMISNDSFHSNGKSDSQSGCEINFTPRRATTSNVSFYLRVHVSDRAKSEYVGTLCPSQDFQLRKGNADRCSYLFSSVRCKSGFGTRVLLLAKMLKAGFKLKRAPT